MSLLGDIGSAVAAVGGAAGGFLLGGPAGAAAGLAAGASLGGSMLTNATNTANIASQEQFQENMSDTAYQRATADMEAAGLNPILAYSMGGASTPMGGTPVIQNSLAQASNSGFDAYSSMVGAQQTAQKTAIGAPAADAASAAHTVTGEASDAFSSFYNKLIGKAKEGMSGTGSASTLPPSIPADDLNENPFSASSIYNFFGGGD